MAQELDHLHFLLIPFMSQSHIIPLTEFGKLLSQHGVAVSIITTPTNKPPTEAGPKLQMIPMEFPELAKGSDDMDSAKELFRQSEMMEAPLHRLMAEMHPKPSCIVSTLALPWTQNLADGFQIPRYIFETFSCFTRVCSHRLSQMPTDSDSDSDLYIVPGIPHRIEFTKAQLPQTTKKSSQLNEMMFDKMRKSRLLARGNLLNSFEEMEGVYAEEYRKIAKKFWCIGPLSQSNKVSIDEHHCISWLDSKDRGSVIYACFGSLCRISDQQIKEIGLGLEASGFPFVWIIRGMDSSLEVEKWLEEEKFEERVEGRGLIIRGWAPQVLILSHPSVGGFLTHCGWNSTLEGVGAGVPMITWPMSADQFYNEKFIVQVLEIGVRVGVEAEAEIEGLMKWDRVKKAIENLMEEDEEGGERRRRAKKLSEMARATLEEGGSSYMNMKLFIQDVISCNKTAI